MKPDGNESEPDTCSRHYGALLAVRTDRPQSPDLPQPLGVSDELAEILHPDQSWLRTSRFRGAEYRPLANGYSMLVMIDDTGRDWYLVFNDGGVLIPGVYETPGAAMNAARKHREERQATSLKP